MSSEARGERQRSYPAITHALVISTFIVPISLIPYVLMRRSNSTLRRKITDLEMSARLLHQDMNAAMSELRIRKDEHRQTMTLLQGLMKETDSLRALAEKQAVEGAASNDTIRTDLRKLLDETQHSRTQAATLRALGTSLADVAAFMHGVELEMGMQTQGKDGRGIERLRLLALKMQSLPQQSKLSADKQDNEGTAERV